MEINAKQVKELRDKTGAGMMDCKKALQECAGDTEKAINWLREKGIARAISKSDRDTKEGRIYSFIEPKNKIGVLVEVNCETDFVGKNEQFGDLCKVIATYISENNPAEVKEDEKIKGIISEAILTIGENIQLARATRYDKENKVGRLNSYIHSNGKIGVLLEMTCATETVALHEQFELLCKDISMHIAATNPMAIRAEELCKDFIEKEREVYRNKALNDGKPEAVIGKIVDGQVQKLYKENCLLQQEFVKDSTKNVQDVISEVISALGEDIQITRFTRYMLGE